MNIAAVPFISSNVQVVHQTDRIEDELGVFSMILAQVSTVDRTSEKQIDVPEQHREKINQILEQIMDGGKIKDELLSILPLIPVEEPELFSMLGMDESDWSEIIAQISTDFEQAEVPITQYDIEEIVEMVSTELDSLFIDKQSTSEEADQVQRHRDDVLFIQSTRQPTRNERTEMLMSALRTIDEKALTLINARMNGVNNRHINVELTRLLEEFHAIKQELSSIMESDVPGKKEGQPLTIPMHDKELPAGIWDMLKSLHEKRSLLMTASPYGEQAKVRPSDITAWIDQMKSNVGIIQMQPQMQPQTEQHKYMSPVEQHVLHMNVAQNGSMQHSEQMISQLKQIVMQSGFNSQSYFQQLSISIQPEQLGEMTIRFIQIEGEMIAKITVYSQVAKQALESQMHQLKHMFAPHQVVIEKQEGVVQTQIDQEHQQEDLDDTKEEQQEERNDQEKQYDSSFQEQFDQIVKESTGE